MPDSTSRNPAELVFEILHVSMIFKAGNCIRLVINLKGKILPGQHRATLTIAEAHCSPVMST